MDKNIIRNAVKKYRNAKCERYYMEPENDPAVTYVQGYITASGDSSYYAALTAAYIAFFKTSSFKSAKEAFDLINVSMGKDLKKYASSDSPVVRRKAASVCVEYNQTIILYDLSADEDYDVRHEVLWQAIKDKEKIIPIIKLFCKDSNNILRENAICELNKLYEHQKISELVYHNILTEAYRTETIYSIRQHRIAAYAFEYGFENILAMCLKDPNENMRLYLVEKGYRLDELANDKSKTVREAARTKLKGMEEK